MTFNFESQRALFPILAKKAQLSSCSQSALSMPVAQAITDYTTGWLERGMDWAGWMETVHAAKAEFARLIHAEAKDIFVMSCVSDIASSIGSSMEFTAEKNGIVVGEIDFPSLGHVWLAHERKGAAVQFVKADDNHCIDLQSYQSAIDDRTCLVSVSHVSYYNGFIQDIRAIADIAHKHDALMFVDAYQSVGALQIDVVRDRIDVLACGAQKFLLGCPGIAFAYIRPELANTLRPSNTGWFGRVNPFAFDIRALDYAPGAPRFDTGTPPMVNAYAVRAGMQLLNSLGMDKVAPYLAHLSSVALQEVKRLGLRCASPDNPAIKASNTAVYVSDSLGVEYKMAQAGFIVSARNDVIRIAPHFYNTEEEVVMALRELAHHAG
jgi:selenocysteine lyase/cysteine desulfurase